MTSFPRSSSSILAMDADLRTAFLRAHGDLLTARFWRYVKKRRLAGEITHVVPYRCAGYEAAAC